MYSIMLRSDDKITGDNNNFTIEMSDVLPKLECGCKYKVKLSNCIINQTNVSSAKYIELRIKIGSTTLYDSKIKSYSSELIFFLADQFDNSIVSKEEKCELMVESFNFNNIEIKVLNENEEYLLDSNNAVPQHVIIVLTFEKI
jgi:hypothetical protein